MVYCGKMKSVGKLSAKLTAGLILSGQDTDPFYAFTERNEGSRSVHISELQSDMQNDTRGDRFFNAVITRLTDSFTLSDGKKRIAV